MKRERTIQIEHGQAILTNDPSMTAWGWVVIKNGLAIVSGCIKTVPDHKKKRIRKSDDTLRRITEINGELARIIKQYDIKYIVSEAPHGSQNASAAVMVGMVAGILQTLADVLNIPIEWYSEMDSKKALLGKKSASKNETIQAIKKVYPTLVFKNIKYQDEAIADAMSVYYTACKFSPTLKMMLNVSHQEK